jgi:hypothetical protein
VSVAAPLIATIAAAVKPWNALYAHSKVVSTGVTFVHVGSLLVGGGLAVASDRAALRARAADAEERRRLLRDFASVHRPVVVALALMTASGAAMALADVETFFVSPLFWTKMAIFAALLGNGLIVMRTERALAADPTPRNPLWRRLGTGAVTSLALWLTTTLAGVILTSI